MAEPTADADQPNSGTSHPRSLPLADGNQIFFHTVDGRLAVVGREGGVVTLLSGFDYGTTDPTQLELVFGVASNYRPPTQ